MGHNMIQEKIIEEYPTYAVTSNGFIRDLRTGQLKIGHNMRGYRLINLSNPNGTKSFLLHRIVAKAFIPNPDNLPEIDHIDRNPVNNDITNLRWCNDFTQAQNKGNQKNNTSGYKNITCEDDYFRVIITRNGKKIVRKRFQQLSDAVNYRNEMYKKYDIKDV
jgi:hypothetical protein